MTFLSAVEADRKEMETSCFKWQHVAALQSDQVSLRLATSTHQVRKVITSWPVSISLQRSLHCTDVLPDDIHIPHRHLFSASQSTFYKHQIRAKDLHELYNQTGALLLCSSLSFRGYQDAQVRLINPGWPRARGRDTGREVFMEQRLNIVRARIDLCASVWACLVATWHAALFPAPITVKFYILLFKNLNAQ